jgi:hypothetical protein
MKKLLKLLIIIWVSLLYNSTVSAELIQYNNPSWENLDQRDLYWPIGTLYYNIAWWIQNWQQFCIQNWYSYYSQEDIEQIWSTRFIFNQQTQFWEEWISDFTANFIICETIEIIPESENPLVILTNNTASGAVSTSGDIMSGPIGYIVYFIVGLAIVGLVVAIVRKWF